LTNANINDIINTYREKGENLMFVLAGGLVLDFQIKAKEPILTII